MLPEAVDSGKCMGDWIMLPLLQRSEAASLRELAGQNGEGSFYADETPWTVRVHNGLSFVTPQQRPDDAPVDAAPPKDELPVDFAALSYRYPYAGQDGLSRQADGHAAQGPACWTRRYPKIQRSHRGCAAYINQNSLRAKRRSRVRSGARRCTL